MGSTTAAGNLRAGAAPGLRTGRVAVAYLAAVAVDVWLLSVLMELPMDRSLAANVAIGTGRFIASALVFVPLMGLGLLPGLALSMELVARTPPLTRSGRALAGGIGWTAWGSIVALSATSLSGLVLFEATMALAIAVLGVSGGAVAALALDRESRPPGRALIGVALAVAAVVIIGSIVMRGGWGGPA